MRTQRGAAVGRVSITTRIDAPPERCFDLNRDVDVHIESTPGTSERAVGGVTSGLLGDRDRVTWEARHLGIRWRMTMEITAYAHPRFLVDEMVSGPFRSFRHFHGFLPDGAGTTMIDIMTYTVPAGLPGRIFDRMILEPYMRHLLTQRVAVLTALAEGRSDSPVTPQT